MVFDRYLSSAVEFSCDLSVGAYLLNFTKMHLICLLLDILRSSFLRQSSKCVPTQCGEFKE